MFTGLIEFVGKTLWLRRTKDSTQLAIKCAKLSRRVHTGDSVAVNGCCLTVTSHRNEQINFDLLEETLEKTNLKMLRPDDPANLERALSVEGRLGGHFVQGHVDSTSKIMGTEKKGGDLKIEVEIPRGFSQYLAYKGSVAINGVSLTVAEVDDTKFSVWVIPHTQENTNLETLQNGSMVNLEFDILAKYTERILAVKDARH